MGASPLVRFIGHADSAAGCGTCRLLIRRAQPYWRYQGRRSHDFSHDGGADGRRCPVGASRKEPIGRDDVQAPGLLSRRSSSRDCYRRKISPSVRMAGAVRRGGRLGQWRSIWLSAIIAEPDRLNHANAKVVLVQLAVMSCGSALAAANHSMAVTIAGTLLIGAVLTPLGTYYSLALDALAPPERRPEIFALLRTSQAIGVVFASALLALFGLSTALVWVTVLMIAVTAMVAVASRG